MGRRGPKPTPTKLLQMRGSWRGKKNKSEPKPEPGVPDCPLDLRGESLATWRIIVPLLERCGILTKVDRNVLARYCDLWGEYCSVRGQLSRFEDRLFLTSRDIKDKLSLLRVSLALSTELQRLEGQLGLTPSARSRLELEHGTIGEKAQRPAASNVADFVNTG